MENLLLYAPQAKHELTLPLPIGEGHKFAPIALGVRLSSPSLACSAAYSNRMWLSSRHMFYPERVSMVLVISIGGSLSF